jgi:plastocyanin
MKLLRCVGALALVAVLGCEEDEPKPVDGSVVDLAGVSTDLASTVSTDMAGAAPADLAGTSTAQTVNVTVGPNGAIAFAPMSVTIHPGDTVLWTWQGGPHTVTSGTPGAPDGKFCSLPAGSDVNATTCNTTAYARFPPFTYSQSAAFSTPGTFPYFCEVHGAAMTGTVVVVAR